MLVYSLLHKTIASQIDEVFKTFAENNFTQEDKFTSIKEDKAPIR